MRYFLAILTVAGNMTAVAAQTPASPLVQKYYNCFDASTRSQFAANIAAEPNMVAELAFQACATEEQMILTSLSLATVPSNQAWALILRHRAILKRRIAG
jgi:hypothetical protein